ncbi:MAG: immunoglobulin domain-containing protein [Candidatus Hydrogenedens sp.]
MMKSKLKWSLLVLCLLTNYAFAVVYVNKASTDPSPDGSSWAKAFRTIQEGIDTANAQASPGNPVEVWVAQGNYDELRTATWGAPALVDGSLVMEDNVHLYGGFKGTETSRDQRRPSQYVTTIDGRTSRGGTNAYHVIVIGKGSGPNTDVVIDGFHIRGGRASGVAGDYHTWRGAGIYNWLSAPVIGNCVFYDNVSATAGGAIANMSGTVGSNIYKASALIHDCVFRGNTCNETVDTGVSPIRGGAGIFNNGINSSNVEIGNETYITNCTFYNNTSANLSNPQLYNANTIMNSGCGVNFPKIYNTILWNNPVPSNPHIRTFRPGLGYVNADVQYSDVQGGHVGTGNINSDPLFRNPGNNDFRLTVTFPSPISPCLDTGADGLVQPPLAPGRVDIRNFQRKNGSAVDMGAYENVATPVADFSATPVEILAGQSVQFTDSSDTFGLWAETTWAWNFGDSGTSNQQNPSHQYNTAGRYTVSLTVQTAEGNDNETKTNYIVVHTPPTADFSAAPTQGQYPLTVTFTDSSIPDQLPENTTQITDWYWDFNGDGNDDAHYTTPTNPQWTYNSVGVYTVRLRVVTQYGEDTETKTNYIDVWPNPLAVSNIAIQEFDPPRDSPFSEDDFSSPTANNLTDGYIGFGRSFRMTVNASGGYGPPYQYQWQIFKGGSWVNISNGSYPRNVNGSDGPNNTPIITVISGATTNQLTVEYAIPGQEDGQYRCVVTDPNDTPPPPNQVISGTKTITINTNVMRTVVDLTTPVRKYIGENVIYSFKFIGGSGSNYLYQWYIDRSGSLTPVGSGSNPVNIPNLDQTMIGNYYGTAINISDGGQTVFAGPSSLDVQPVVAISAQPQSIHRNTGGSAQFSVTISGGYAPYTYEWLWNDTTPLVDGPHPSGSGAIVSINNVGSTSTLTISNLGLIDAGQYKCRVTDSENRGAPSTEDSQNATLLITNPFVITDPTPSPVNQYEGSNYSVTVTASGGTTPYTFTWQRDTGSGYVTLNDGDLGGRVSIVSGASNSVFTINGTVVGDTGTYRCIAVDSGPDPDAYPANAGVLNVYENLVVDTEHPADVIENVGNQAQFAVQRTGGIPTINYEWQYATDQGGPWTTLTNGPHPLHASSIVSGADESTLTIQIAEGAHLSGLQNSYYRCVVTDSGTPQSGTSRIAKLSITNFINVQGPADVRAYTGESPVQLITNVTGGQPPFYYEWFKGTESILGPEEGHNVLDLGSADATDEGDYYVIVSDSSGGLNPPVTSRTANVKVADPPQIVTQPQSLNLYAGQDAIFQVEVVGGFEPYNYDWWQIGMGSLGVNNNTLLLSNVDVTYDGNQYLVYISDQPSTVTGLNTTLTSDPVLLRVASSEVIFTLQPEDESLYINDPSFWLTADFVGGLPPVYYEWKRDLPGGGTEVVAGNTLEILVNTASLTVGTYKYYLEVTDDIPMLYQSRKANIEVGLHLSFIQDLLPEYRATSGERVEMFVQVNGGLGDKTYTWYRNVGGKAWEVIPGAIGPLLVIDPAQHEDSGQYYVVVQDSGSSVTGQNDTITSTIATLEVEKGIPATTSTGLLVMILISSIIGVMTVIRKRACLRK